MIKAYIHTHSWFLLYTYVNSSSIMYMHVNCGSSIKSKAKKTWPGLRTYQWLLKDKLSQTRSQGHWHDVIRSPDLTSDSRRQEGLKNLRSAEVSIWRGACRSEALSEINGNLAGAIMLLLKQIWQARYYYNKLHCITVGGLTAYPRDTEIQCTYMC